MIDNPDEVNELMREMEACLPIPVRPASQFERYMKREGQRLSEKTQRATQAGALAC